MLDFYADWCVECRQMEKYTFSDPQVRIALGGMRLLQADVTANDEADRALLRHFGIYGPPTIAFFDSRGRERANLRLVGYQPADEFRRHLQRALAPPGAAP
jgi:thiol:disulfide interchange protein DsbD